MRVLHAGRCHNNETKSMRLGAEVGLHETTTDRQESLQE